MTTQYALPIIHPAFELLKRSAKILHFIAASVILLNAFHEFMVGDLVKLIYITQAIIAIDIFLMVFFTGEMLSEAPRLNLIFRFIESMVLLGIGFTLMGDGHNWPGIVHIIASVSYFFLLYREARIIKEEKVRIRATGITIPDLVKNVEIGWNEIRTVIPKYHGIFIETLCNKRIEFKFRRNLKIDELEQIDEFCREHLGDSLGV